MTTPGDCAGEYNVTRTWTATDACGNSSQASQTINVIDTDAPVIAELPAPSTINCPAEPVFATATATDTCGSDFTLTYADVTTPGDCAGEYSVTRTWTATDACGNASTASQTINVQDITAPVIISCVGDQTITSTAACTAEVPNYTLSVEASDSCTAAEALTITQSPAAGTVVNAGMTLITMTVKDACGNENQCTFNLTVLNFIDAKDDLFSNINGISGNTNVGNVLNDNGNGADSLNCNAATIDAVNMTIVTPATPIGNNPVPSINGTTGQVSVPSGTPAGSYTIVYQICDKIFPENCDQATVTITVDTPFIVAEDDNINAGNGTNGNPNAGNVLVDNGNGPDTLAGEEITIDEVTMTVITPAMGNSEGSEVPEIDTTTGQISVPADTPAGTYTIDYQICDVLNPTNCDQATVTIIVTAPPIDAVHDIANIVNTVTGVNPSTGGPALQNVLDNDSLNEETATLDTVNLTLVATTNPGVTLNTSNGSVNVAPGTPGGTYALTYEICDKLNPTNCDQATVTVFVEDPQLLVIKTADVEGYSFEGDIINYTIEVTNPGNVTLSNITVSDPLIVLNAIIESLAPGESQVFTGSYTVVKSDLETGSVSNTATANGYTPDETPISDTDGIVIDRGLVLGCGTIEVHNAFTPNGDGINESFVIDNIDDTVCYPENTVQIYNRWGVLVYETKNYNNLTNFFDGFSSARATISEPSGLPTGTYFYILTYSSVDLVGDTEINRKEGYLYLSR